jgi:hypothetical protein
MVVIKIIATKGFYSAPALYLSKSILIDRRATVPPIGKNCVMGFVSSEFVFSTPEPWTKTISHHK